jgi:hypothetical protein
MVRHSVQAAPDGTGAANRFTMIAGSNGNHKEA